MLTTFEINDNNVITQLSIECEGNFLPCIDAEELDVTDGSIRSQNNKLTQDNKENLLKRITVKNIETDNKKIDFEKGFEIYKAEHPDDDFPFGHYVLSLP